MDLGTAVEPVTELKTRSAQLIKKARTSGQPIVITQNGKATAVLQDVESYEEQRRVVNLDGHPVESALFSGALRWVSAQFPPRLRLAVAFRRNLVKRQSCDKG